MSGLTFLGTSGQNIRDMLLNSLSPDTEVSEGDKCLFRIKQTLEMRHLCPTAPDTLRVFPFKESDPFVINSHNNASNLELSEDEADITQGQNLFTEVPHVYFVGNMQEYKEQLLTRKAGSTTQYLKVISLPTFYLSHSIVLLDLQTL